MSNPITSPRARREALLAWYDRHHRKMPWRVTPPDRADGRTPDPYHVWLSEVMLQQTTVAAVTSYFQSFVTRWPSVCDLAGAADEDLMAAWAGLGYYARARNLLKCARAVAHDLDGQFPDSEAALLKLPGIGPYTAAAIAAIAFDRRATVLDGNVERVMARLFAEHTPLPAVKETLRGHAASLTPPKRPGDHAQAVMDLGATICTPRKPACALCPWKNGCASFAAGDAETLPKKTPKAAKPVRHAIGWAGFDGSNRILCVRRPPRGLLGGMLALPATAFSSRSGPPEDTPPCPAEWKTVGEVRHTFTHFHLIMDVRAAHITAEDANPADFQDIDAAAAAMPTLFSKAVALVRPEVTTGES